jgi:hypothetical protein
VTFGTVKRAETGSANLTFTIIQGKTATCVDRVSAVSAAITSLTGEADDSNSLTSDELVVLGIGTLSGTSFPMTAAVPKGAAEQAFGATVTLTLSNNT